MKRIKFTFVALFALTAILSAPIFAQSTPVECAPQLNRAIASDAEILTIVETADAIAAVMPSRGRIATIENTEDRIYLTQVLDHVEAAQRADKMSPQELEEFADGLLASVSSAQIGIAACPVATTDAVSIGRQAAPGCSCAQQCYNEWRANLRTCNGGYWCEVGFNLLFELCLLDCIVPG